MTATRTDVHRPSAAEFDPADYQFTGVVYDGRADWPQANTHFRQVQAALLADGYTYSGVHGGRGQCDHCGALLRYSALMIHTPSRTLIYVGERCLDNRFESMTKSQFQAARQAAKLDRERQAKKVAFLALCDTEPTLVWATYAHNIGVAGLGDHRADLPALEQTWGQRYGKGWAIGVLDDIATKARRYGDLSPAQAALVARLVGELEDAEQAAAEREEQRAAERASRANAYQGAVKDRITVTGTIRLAKVMSGYYGDTTLLVIDTPAGTVKWFATGDRGVDAGEQLTLTGTVKAHEEYQGERQTVLTRCRIA
jgi:hypothetical protein